MAEITLTEKQARALYKKLRVVWWNDECTADLDDAMRALDTQLEALDPEERDLAETLIAASRVGIGTITMFGKPSDPGHVAQMTDSWWCPVHDAGCEGCHCPKPSDSEVTRG